MHSPEKNIIFLRNIPNKIQQSTTLQFFVRQDAQRMHGTILGDVLEPFQRFIAAQLTLCVALNGLLECHPHRAVARVIACG